MYINRRFALVSSTAKKTVDLREYKDTIHEAIHDLNPEINVRVCAEYFETDRITRREATLLGRKLAQTGLGKFCVPVYRLFYGS